MKRGLLFSFGLLVLMSILLFGCSEKGGITGKVYEGVLNTTLNCTDDCSPAGIKVCEGNVSSKTCGNYDADGCLEWSQPEICQYFCMQPNGTCWTCTPNCVGKQCGYDGCGGSCGTCPTGQICTYNRSLAYCVSCTPKTCSQLGKKCGSWYDGCSTYINCGTCPTGKICSNGVCKTCTPKTCSQLGKKCGSWYDGCSKYLNCGTCSSENVCVSGVCKPKCTDTDGGKIYNITGSIKLGNIVKATDSCSTNLTLKEFYCSSSTAYSSVNYNCKNIKKVCLGGACK